jgi:SAM-dependent methyltransferase
VRPVSGLLSRALALAPVQRAARLAADLIDLQYSMVITQLTKAAPRTHGRLLDVGCGDKPYETIFRPYVTEYIGIEHEDSFPHTSASAAARRPDLYYRGSVLPFPDHSFDTVLSVQVLEHTPHPQLLVDEMARVLRKDGVLVLSAPFSFRLHEEPHDYFRYTPHGLRSMCNEAGLEVTEIWSQGDLWSVLAHKLNSFLAFRVMAVQSTAQQLGKLKHEAPAASGGRLWLAPVVVPPMAFLSVAARVLDRLAPDGTETLSYTVFAKHRTG